MDDATAMVGSLTDVRNVNTTKSLKLTVEIPAELAPTFINQFGWPTAANPITVAIALMVEDATAYTP
jgi:hypothetical protein